MSASTRQSTTVDYVEEYAAAAEQFAVAVAWADLRAPVVSCPGWSTYDLVVHLGNVHAWAATIVETGQAAAAQNDEPSSEKPRTVSEWYAGKAEDLYEVLRSTPPDTACWNFAFGTGDAGFWHRRQLHETNVHQIDLDLVTERQSALAPDICADGVGEVLDVFLHRMHQRGHPARLDGPVALAATDTGDTWVVRPADESSPSDTIVPAQPQGTTEESVPSRPPVVEHRRTLAWFPDRVEATAEVLYRVLWKRLPYDDAGVRIVGDRARVEAFLGSRLAP